MILLSKNAQRLLEKAKVANVGSYAFRKSDKKAAKELVDKGHAFYSMDYDHIGLYRHETHDSGSLGPMVNENPDVPEA